MLVNAIWKKINAGDIAPVYLLTGDRTVLDGYDNQTANQSTSGY